MTYKILRKSGEQEEAQASLQGTVKVQEGWIEGQHMREHRC